VDWLIEDVPMAESAPLVRIVLTTAANPEEAEGLARAFVEERLAACVTLIPSVRSIYRWEGKVEEATETLLLIKTGADQLAALEERLRTLHSYETPEFLVLETAGASSDYLEWMVSNLGKAPGPV
jgi:periplasmic divalent cation tolerance protein